MSIPVITVAQMREWEKVTWASGQTEEAVIQQAGAAVARLAERVTHPNDFVLVLAGKGHNGDDARLAANQIQNRALEILGVTDPETASAALRKQLSKRPALVIDGLFGIGLSRALAADWEKLIQILNASGRPVLAVDTPSGLHADLGTPLDVAVRARWTLTLGAVKAGLLRSTAWPFVGRLEVAPDIGLVEYPFQTELSYVEAADFLDYPPARPSQAHKGTLGHLHIVAGSQGYHGAAVLAARGAQRARPGLITLQTSDLVYVPVAAALQSVMVRSGRAEVALPPKCSALLMGPGLAGNEVTETMRQSVMRQWREATVPVVADASALDWIPSGPTPPGSVRVLTPHPGDAARMLNRSTNEVQSDRPGVVRELSRRWGGCEVVLKGHQTIMGNHKSELFVNCSGNPDLAQGGSGDLLAGYLAGWLAQPELQEDAARAIRYAVWQHGAAADDLRVNRPNWIIEELAGALGSIAPA